MDRFYDYRVQAKLSSTNNTNQNPIEIDMYLMNSLRNIGAIGTIEGIPDEEGSESLFLDQAALLADFSINKQTLKYHVEYHGAPIKWRNKSYPLKHEPKGKVFDQSIICTYNMEKAVVKNSVIIGKKLSDISSTIFFDGCILENCTIVANAINIKYNCFFLNCVIYTDQIVFDVTRRAGFFIDDNAETIPLCPKQKVFTVTADQKMSEIKIDGVPSSVFNLLYDKTIVRPRKEFSNDSVGDPVMGSILTNIVVKKEEFEHNVEYKNKKIFMVMRLGRFCMDADQCIITGSMHFDNLYEKSFTNCKFLDCEISDINYPMPTTFDTCEFHLSVCDLNGGVKIENGKFYNSVLTTKSKTFKDMRCPLPHLEKSILQASYSGVITSRKKSLISTTNSNIHFVLQKTKHIGKIEEYIKNNPSFCKKGIVDISVRESGDIYHYGFFICV